MKILYIGNQLQHKGKSPTTVDTLSVYLRSEGYEVITYSKKENQFIRILDMVLGILKNKNANYVLIDTYSTSAFWFTLIVSQCCRLFNLKYIPYLHGGNLPARLDKNPKLCNLIFNNAYFNAAPSGYLKYEFEKRKYNNIKLIPNTIEINNYEYKIREALTPKILWVRAFASIYNPTLAIDILVKLKESYPDAQLCMVGPEKDGSLELTKNYAKSKNVKVTFTGKLEKKDWIKLSENYNIFLNTTNFDNTPVSVMEAMALGLPIVSTNVGGIPFLIENGVDGYLTNPKDTDALVNGIKSLISDSEKYKNIISKARIKAEAWDWQSVKKIWKEQLK